MEDILHAGGYGLFCPFLSDPVVEDVQHGLGEIKRVKRDVRKPLLARHRIEDAGQEPRTCSRVEHLHVGSQKIPIVEEIPKHRREIDQLAE